MDGRKGAENLYYLEQAPIRQAIRHLSVPMMLTMTLSTIQNLINGFFIGRTGNTAMLAAISIGSPVGTVFMAVAGLFGIGTASYISRQLGQRGYTEIRKASAVNFWLSLAAGVALMTVCLPLITPICRLLGAEGETLNDTRQYLFYTLLGMPFFVARFTLVQAVRGTGAIEVAMTAMAGSILLNIALDAVFVPILKMGLLGIQTASAIADFAAAVYLLRYIRRKSSVLSVSIRHLRPNRPMLGAILKIGFSSCILDLFMLFSITMFHRFAMTYGPHVLASFGIVNRVLHLVELLGIGICIGIVPLLGFAWSTANRGRFDEIVRKSVRYILTLTVLLGSLLFVFRGDAIRLFSSDPAVLTVGNKVMIAQLSSTVFGLMTIFFNGIFQAAGSGIRANAMSVVRGLFLVPILYFANRYFGLNGLIWALTVSEMLSFLAGWMMYRGLRGKQPLRSERTGRKKVRPNPERIRWIGQI